LKKKIIENNPGELADFVSQKIRFIVVENK